MSPRVLFLVSHIFLMKFPSNLFVVIRNILELIETLYLGDFLITVSIRLGNVEKSDPWS